MKWRKTESYYVQPDLSGGNASSPFCPKEFKHSVILGFAKWYCDPSSTLHDELGDPDSGEHLGAIQFQDWSRGLLIYGIPTRTSDYGRSNPKVDTSATVINDIPETVIGDIAVTFLQREKDHNTGVGEWRRYSLDLNDKDVKCSPLWHWIRTTYKGPTGEEVLNEYYKNGTCGTLNTLDEYKKAHRVCRQK
jgi:hypothetical protein